MHSLNYILLLEPFNLSDTLGANEVNLTMNIYGDKNSLFF